jgi:glycosyltransferase involved in cell wall biosynthesis
MLSCRRKKKGMQPVSVVIIVKNEAHIIEQTMAAVQSLSDDILICDTGSTDDTIAVAKAAGARVIQEPWQGFGPTKNKANKQAKYDWILQIDADEVPHISLIRTLNQLLLNDVRIKYKVVLKNYYCGRYLRFGNFKDIQRVRLFNRTIVTWNEDDVHEALVSKEPVKEVLLKGYIQHYTYTTIEEHLQKIENYTNLSAALLFKQKKKASFIKLYLSPVVSFFTNYALKLGFLDGYYGFKAAWLSARHSHLKYKKLDALYKSAIL